MGLYDFLYEHKMTYDDLVQIIYDLRKFVDFDAHKIIDQTDELYDHDEYNQFVNNQNKGA